MSPRFLVWWCGDDGRERGKNRVESRMMIIHVTGVRVKGVVCSFSVVAIVIFILETGTGRARMTQLFSRPRIDQCPCP